MLENINGETVPIGTAAFLGTGEEIYSQEEFDEMIDNGGFLLEKQAMDIETAINEWQEDVEMSDVQINLLKSVFQRKIDNPSEVIVLTVEEIQMIESEDAEGLTESRISFEEMSIEWEV
ncbi:hypothetical protein [Bacillus pseudomycoides]|uniref:hypothetical protein n=1 Tax=Bacillus pseudomycoides TaxID=64104 RepID=UPI003D1A3B45